MAKHHEIVDRYFREDSKTKSEAVRDIERIEVRNLLVFLAENLPVEQCGKAGNLVGLVVNAFEDALNGS